MPPSCLLAHGKDRMGGMSGLHRWPNTVPGTQVGTGRSANESHCNAAHHSAGLGLILEAPASSWVTRVTAPFTLLNLQRDGL